MKWKPIGTQIIVKVEKKSETTKAGLILTTTDQEFDAPTSGTVIAIGSSIAIDKDIKVGKSVLFPPYTGMSLEIAEEKYIIMDGETSVLAVLK